MSATNSLHYQLCCEAAKWLRRRKHDYKKCESKPCYKPEFCRVCHSYKYVAVEINTYGIEQTDVWGWNGYETAVIEVKTSHNDFLNDMKKECRQDTFKDLQCGNYRWYLCPEDVIKPSELPSNWGLLYWNGKSISHVVAPKCVNCAYKGDLLIIYSILRREGLKGQIFNYRGTNDTIKPKTVIDYDDMKPLDSDISKVVSENLFNMV